MSLQSCHWRDLSALPFFTFFFSKSVGIVSIVLFTVLYTFFFLIHTGEECQASKYQVCPLSSMGLTNSSTALSQSPLYFLIASVNVLSLLTNIIYPQLITYFFVNLCLYRSHLSNQKTHAEHLWLFQWICQSEMHASIFTSCGKLKKA